MKVELYGKPGCEVCRAAEQKLQALGVEYHKHDLGDYLRHRDDWRRAGFTDVSTAYYLLGRPVPLLCVDGKFFDYPKAMKRLKEIRREQAAKGK